MVLINGIESDSLEVADRAVQYGDGLFETIAVRAGRARAWARHMARLEWGCRRLGIPVPDGHQLLAEAHTLCASVDAGVLKLIISRGQGGRGYRAPHGASPTRILQMHPWPDYPRRFYDEGIALRVCSTPLGCNPVLAGIKHLNRLEQVLARSEWDNPEIAEGLMLDTFGHVVSGTMTNVFAVHDGRVLTPDVTRCGIAGVMRERVIEALRRMSRECHVGTLGLEDIRAADEVFVTNSVAGIWPVARLEDHEYDVGGVTRDIVEQVEAIE